MSSAESGCTVKIHGIYVNDKVVPSLKIVDKKG